MTQGLDTIRRYDFGGALPKGLTAHPKIDPITGEMVVFRYDIEAPFLTWAVVAADGTMAQPETIVDGVDHSFMIHDFAITEHFLVLTVAPAVFDIDAMLAGGSMLAWKPELGVRIAVIPRDGTGQTRWFETDPFWAWHYANAYEFGNTIRMDFPRWNAPGFLTPGTPVMGEYARVVLDLDAGTTEIEVLQDAVAEFPRIDDRLLGRPHRYVILTAGSGSVALAPGEHDALCRRHRVGHVGGVRIGWCNRRGGLRAPGRLIRRARRLLPRVRQLGHRRPHHPRHLGRSIVPEPTTGPAPPVPARAERPARQLVPGRLTSGGGLARRGQTA